MITGPVIPKRLRPPPSLEFVRQILDFGIIVALPTLHFLLLGRGVFLTFIGVLIANDDMDLNVVHTYWQLDKLISVS